MRPTYQRVRTFLVAFSICAMVTVIFFDPRVFAATPVPIASTTMYFEDFGDIANWTNNFASGTGANRWGSVAVNATGTIPDGVKTTVSSATFATGGSGGVQRGTGTIVLLSTGTTDNTSSVAIDVFLDFTGANAGALSFDWASVNNSTGDRKASLRVYTSTDGTTFMELPSAAVLNFTNNVSTSGSITSVSLPASFNSSSTARIRFYEYNGAGGTTGSRPKISIDNVKVTIAQSSLRFRSAGSGNWGSNSTWELSADGSNWIAATQTPTSANDTITIRSPHTVTITADVNAEQVTVDSGGTLKVNNGITLTVDDDSGTDLIVNGTGTVSGTGVIGGAGSFTLSSGATLEIGSTDGINSGTSLGNIRVSGTRTFDSGANYNFNGSAAQVTGNGLPVVVNNLSINNSAGVTLSRNTTVAGTLTLQTGDMYTASFTLLMGTNATSMGTGDVVGSVNRGDLNGGVTRSFGNPDVQIKETAGSVNDMTITLYKGVAANDFSNSVRRIYTITPNNGVNLVATVRLHYLDSELNNNSESMLDLWRKTGNTWLDQMQTTRHDETLPADQNYVELTLVNQFSDWTLANSNITPTAVEAVVLKATRYDNRVLLEWQTGYEVNNVGFNIYRERNGNLERVTPEPVAGSALIAGPGVVLSTGFAYSWWDDGIADCGSPSANCQNIRYWVEDLDLTGRTTTHGPFALDLAPPDQTPPPGKGRASLLSGLGSDAPAAGSTVPVETKANPIKPTPALVAAESGLASQTAVKLSVQHEGWYRVELADLRAAAFPAGVDPQMLQLFVDGEQVPIVVTTGDPKPSWTGIEFYGIGIDSPSTANHVYWLVAASQLGARIITPTGALNGSPAPAAFSYTVERRDRVVYFPALKNGGGEKFFGPLVLNAQPADQSLLLQHVAASGPNATLQVSVQGFTAAHHSVRVLLNGTELGTLQFDGLAKGTAQYSIAQSALKEGSNQVQLISPAGFSDISMSEYVRLTYLHTNDADNNALRFPAAGGQQVTVKGFTDSNIRLIDVTEPGSPQELAGKVTNAGTGFSITANVPGTGARRLLAFAPDQEKKPAAMAANQPSSWRDPSRAGDYLVITRKDLIDSLGPLVAHRKSQGLTPAVVDIEDVYDEFSFGNKTPQALKDFISYAKGNWAKPPRFVVLAGDATYDPKNNTGAGDFDLVPTKLVETAFNETATDDWFVDMNGDDLPDIPVGRLPVRTPEETAALVSKIVGYDATVRTKSVLLVADRNSGFDFEAADTQLRSLIPAKVPVTDIRLGQVGDFDARSQLLNAINQGQRLVNYYGHGSVLIWANAPLLRASDAASLTNQNHLSLFVAMTCLSGFFQDVTIDSLAESLLKAQGGAIAVWASSGLTDPNAQTVMNQAAIRQLLGPLGTKSTIGEHIMRAKGVISDVDVRRTWILLGDPATRLK